MKTRTLPTYLLICFLSCSLSASGQETQAFPFYIRVLQNYTYEGTSLSSSAGEVEQVIAESGAFLILSAPTGSTVQLPKHLAQRISAEAAAASLIAERSKYQAQMAQLIAVMSQSMSSSDGMSELTNYMRQMRELQELSKPDRRRIPSGNRYEIHVK